MLTHPITTRQDPFLELPALQELAGLTQWVNWMRVERDGKTTKVPTVPSDTVTGYEPASTSDPYTWCDFETVTEAYNASQLNGKKIQGRGFVFAGLHVGIDLDHCVEWTGGEPFKGEPLIDSWAQEIIDRF